MAGLFTGIIGSIFGAGIQAVVGGIPISEDASKALHVLRQGGLPVPPANWFTPKASNEQTEQSTKQVLDRIGQHVTGAMQAIGPCTQIARALEAVVYPRSQPEAAKVPKYEYQFHAPQGVASKSVISPIMKSCEPGGSCGCSSSIKSTETEKTKKIEMAANRSPALNDFNAQKDRDHYGRPKASERNEADSLVKGKILGEENGRDPRDREMEADKFAISEGISKDSQGRQSTVKKNLKIAKGQTKLIAPRNQSGKSVDIKKCQLCQVETTKENRLAALSCGHVLCYKCLTGRKGSGCRKCRMSRKRN